MDVTIIVLTGATSEDLENVLKAIAQRQSVTPELEEAIKDLGVSIQAVDNLNTDSTSD